MATGERKQNTTAIELSDLFMERLEASGKGNNPVEWSFFGHTDTPGLREVYGTDFKKLYEKHEAEGKAKEKIDIWLASLLLCTDIRFTGRQIVFRCKKERTCLVRSMPRHATKCSSCNDSSHIMDWEWREENPLTPRKGTPETCESCDM